LLLLLRALDDRPVERVVPLEPLFREQVAQQLAQVRVVGFVVEAQGADVLR
jgi:hypothetical protein